MLFALTFLIQFSNKKQNKNLNFDTFDIHLLQILCNFVQSIFNIKYDTWYIFLFLFFKSQLIRRILRYMKLQWIKWSVQWIIYSDMEIEEKKQEHSNTWIVHEKSGINLNAPDLFLKDSLYNLENSSEETIPLRYLNNNWIKYPWIHSREKISNLNVSCPVKKKKEF